mmetsp:Transcript_18242/g.51128  ORF Transcript_18242/g.51128 Transcript_18242/m.51128 type:complete len:246 (-) Transcript_18242:1587-2324(-)
MHPALARRPCVMKKMNPLPRKGVPPMRMRTTDPMGMVAMAAMKAMAPAESEPSRAGYSTSRMQGVARPCMRGMVPILWQTQQRAEPLMVCMLETGASASLQQATPLHMQAALPSCTSHMRSGARPLLRPSNSSKATRPAGRPHSLLALCLAESAPLPSGLCHPLPAHARASARPEGLARGKTRRVPRCCPHLLAPRSLHLALIGSRAMVQTGQSPPRHRGSADRWCSVTSNSSTASCSRSSSAAC